MTLKTVIAQALGYFVLLPACLLHAWTGPTYPSIKPYSPGQYAPERKFVDQWKWKWLNYWYANTEDGVSGQYALVWNPAVQYEDDYTLMLPHWTPKWAIAWCWSAWRNGANNVKRASRTDGLNKVWTP